MKPTFMPSPAALRRWFSAHHETEPELWIGIHKRHTGEPSITWPEAVDEALCVGWIDGVRKSMDDRRYMIRFTPRRPGSIWSAVNIERVSVLTESGRMRAAGLAAFRARDAKRAQLYSYENRPRTLGPPYAATFRKNSAAWAFYEAQAPWYRRTTSWWVMSAKKEETRQRRLATLMADSASGRRIAQVEIDRRPASAVASRRPRAKRRT